jgi:hypothetical protein
MADADELVGIALLAMLHDTTGLTGEIDYVSDGPDRERAYAARWGHLEVCAGAEVIGPVTCSQEATSTGTGFEVMTAQIGCPHGVPLLAKTAAYGTRGLLEKMTRLGDELVNQSFSAALRKGIGS